MNTFTKSILGVAASALFAMPLQAASFTVGDLTYTTLDDATVSVTKYTGGSEVVIPDKVSDGENEYTVVSLGNKLFENKDVESVTLPSTLTKIGKRAFCRSVKLETIEIPEGVTEIGFSAFLGCTSLYDVKLPSTLVELGALDDLTGGTGWVFNGCTSLGRIEIPASLKELPDLTFVECVNLTEVILHDGLESIGERVFEKCKQLSEIEIPSTVTTIGRGAFQYSGLEHPVVPGNVKIIPNSCFLWCDAMTGFTIEEGVVEIGRQSFADTKFEQIVVPNSVEWIRTDAFQGNGSVKTIELGEGVRRLGHACLAVWVPDQATNTPQWSLTDITIKSAVPPVHEPNDEHFDEVDDDFFFGGKEFKEELREKFYSEVKLYVPLEAIDAYKEAVIWKEFKNIIGLTSGVGNVEACSEAALSVNAGVVNSTVAGIEVYNASGERVAATSSETLDLCALGAGLYIVRSGEAAVKTIVR